MRKLEKIFFFFILASYSFSQQILEPSKEIQIILNNSEFLEIPLLFRKTLISIHSLDVSTSTYILSDKLGLEANKNCYASDAHNCQSFQ
jgi:hypothetical protein